MNRVVCQFSCGAASAVATKITLAQSDNPVLIVNAFLKEEHEDNRRFLNDCEKWFNHHITILRDDKYGASTHEVWRRKNYMKGPRGAPCSLELKRKLLATLSLPGDLNVVGFTVEEGDRLDDLREHFPDKIWSAPLIDKGLSKEDCLAIIADVPIELPLMYRLGFDNANCIGCPKGGQNYWQHIRHHFPDEFIQISNIQQSIGAGANFLQFRSGPRKGERMALAELPAGLGNMADEPSFSCSFFCEMAKVDMAN